jgi:hypothetical protein
LTGGADLDEPRADTRLHRSKQAKPHRPVAHAAHPSTPLRVRQAEYGAVVCDDKTTKGSSVCGGASVCRGYRGAAGIGADRCRVRVFLHSPTRNQTSGSLFNQGHFVGRSSASGRLTGSPGHCPHTHERPYGDGLEVSVVRFGVVLRGFPAELGPKFLGSVGGFRPRWLDCDRRSSGVAPLHMRTAPSDSQEVSCGRRPG